MSLISKPDFKESTNIMYNSALFSLSNTHGMKVSLSTFGGGIRHIFLPNSKFELQNIALSLSKENDYFSSALYAGSILAPNAGRIQDGKLTINQKTYTLSKNENLSHNLHGGYRNAALQNWAVLDTTATAQKSSVTFYVTLPDGLDGFPGNRKLQATYTLDNSDTLTLQLFAETDQDTYLNLSSHLYFNLSGNFSTSALDHQLRLAADHVIYNRADHIPKEIKNVAHTPFDFQMPQKIRSQMEPLTCQQLKNSNGYNHAFILKKHSLTQPQAVLSLPSCSRSVSLFTDASCIVFYSGGFIENRTPLSNEQFACPSCALAMEAQDYPNAPRNSSFPYSILRAGKSYKRTIQWRFTF
ncbi:MAG: aldose epimerase family protein [Lachnospiraceae bacterium]